MLAFAYYILKVIICSTVLIGYYWFFLRNKIFHSYNRFYLLATVMLSLSLPMMKFNVWQKEAAPKTAVVKILQVVNNSDEYMDEIIIQSHYKHITNETLAWWLFFIISSFFTALFVGTIFRIWLLRKNNSRQLYGDISLIHTRDKRTPFSFLKNIFWNDEIDINSINGKRIVKHELAHVTEKHSHDKLFLNIVLLLFWCNPVFWLIRKELNMIHEFIADRKAVEDGDTTAFAAMILQATYPGHRFELTNNFFYSPIKRRLTMLTKNNRNKVNYISRLLVLPLAFIVFAAFTLKTKTYIGNFPKNKTITVVLDAGHGGTDTGGAAYDGSFEKDLNLALVKKIKELNTNDNIRILLTRETDIYQTPKEKAALTKKLGADIFITIHNNSEPQQTSPASTGMEVLISKKQYQNSEKSKLLGSAVINAFLGNYKLTVGKAPLQKENGIWVLQEADCPAVLIEAGFISNKKDLSYLQSADGMDQFATNTLNAIADFATTWQTVIDDSPAFADTTPLKKKAINKPTVVRLTNATVITGIEGVVRIEADTFEINEDEKAAFGKHPLLIINGEEKKASELYNKKISGKDFFTRKTIPKC